MGLVDQETKKVFIGGDSAGVCGDFLILVERPKIFARGAFIFGCTTSFRMMQLVEFSFEPPHPEKRIGFSHHEDLIIDDDILLRYMSTIFVDKLRESMKSGGFLVNRGGQESGGEFLVGYKSRLFKISDDFSVLEYKEGFCAAGSGETYAVSALHVLNKVGKAIKPEKKISLALETAAMYSTGVRPPFHILDTEGKNVTPLQVEGESKGK